MRLRFNKNARSILDASKEYFVCTKNLTQVDPSTWFCNENKNVILEIGCGKGNFIIQNALKYPDTNFVALEKNETILAKAITKAKAHNLNNLKFVASDANLLNELFVNNKFSKIYLNFSDPWPKARHEKRRLTHPNFLSKYKLLLTNNGFIEFKTDHDCLYNYTYYDVLNSNLDKYTVIYQTNDLYNHLTEFNNSDNIATEYEKKNHDLNKNIYKIVFSYK